MEIRIISFLIENIADRFSIREVSRRTGIDYRLVHSAVQRLAGKGVILKEKRTHADLCSLNLNGDLAPVYYVESLKAKTFLSKHSTLQNAFEEVRQRIPSMYYSLIIFGSFAKGLQTKASDLDLMIIAPDRELGEEIARIVNSEVMHVGQRMHLLVVDEKALIDNLKDKKQNVIIEALKNHIILAGAEGFYCGVRKAV